MNEYRYTPRPKNRRAYVLCITLVLLGILAFVLAGMFESYVGSIRMGAVITVVAGLFLGIKFIFHTNTYVLMLTDRGVPYFLVMQAQGRRESLVCQLPLRRIQEVRTLCRGKDKTPRGRYFSYVATMGLKEDQLITAQGDDGKLLQVKIEADEEFLAELRARLAVLKIRKAAPAEPAEETPENT